MGYMLKNLGEAETGSAGTNFFEIFGKQLS